MHINSTLTYTELTLRRATLLLRRQYERMSENMREFVAGFLRGWWRQPGDFSQSTQLGFATANVCVSAFCLTAISYLMNHAGTRAAILLGSPLLIFYVVKLMLRMLRLQAVAQRVL